MLPWELYCHAMGHCLFEKLFACVTVRVTTLLEDNELRSPFELRRTLMLLLAVQTAFVPAPEGCAPIELTICIPSWSSLVAIIERLQ